MWVLGVGVEGVESEGDDCLKSVEALLVGAKV